MMVQHIWPLKFTVSIIRTIIVRTRSYPCTSRSSYSRLFIPVYACHWSRVQGPFGAKSPISVQKIAPIRRAGLLSYRWISTEYMIKIYGEIHRLFRPMALCSDAIKFPSLVEEQNSQESHFHFNLFGLALRHLLGSQRKDDIVYIAFSMIWNLCHFLCNSEVG
jgi:hypothetical protein